MDLRQTHSKSSRKVYYDQKESQQKLSTAREILLAGSAADYPTTMRPPPAGEDSNDSERSKGKLGVSSKPESFHSSSRITPGRFSKKESFPVRGFPGLDSDEEMLERVGFEPEGSAASTPQFERWPTSLSDMLVDCQGFNSFYQFLRQENKENLLDFWRAAESFKRMAPISYEQLRTTAKAIFQKFVFAASSDALEISDTVRNEIAQHINDQSVDCGLFEEALSEIMVNMKNNHYPRFMNTSLYKDCLQSGGESPKDVSLCGRYAQTPRFHCGYLPTLPEEKVLGFDEIEDDGDEFEFEQHRKSVKGLSHCGNRQGSDEHNARGLLHSRVPLKRLLSPYQYPTAPVGSRIESENQSLSSDAMTEDTLSVTDSALTDDTSSRCSDGRRRCSSNRRTTAGHHGGLTFAPFIPRTQRVPKDARHPLASNPPEFARVLTEKLEQVILEREILEREARNLTAHCSEMPKKSILQQAIDNSRNNPLSTMAMSVVPDAPVPYRDTNQNGHVDSGVRSSAPSTSAATVANDTCSKPTQPQQVQKVKKPAPERKEKVVDPEPSMPVPTQEAHVWEERQSQKDDHTPFLTHNHQRIMKWMEEGEQAQQGSPRESRHHRHHSPSTRSGSKSKQSSSMRHSQTTSRHLPNQPIASDPHMPPLPVPHASSVLEETRRRLIEAQEGEKRSKHHQKQRCHISGEADTSIHRERNTASSCCSTKDYSNYAHVSGAPPERHYKDTPPAMGSSAMSSVSRTDAVGRDSGSTKKKEKNDKNEIIITYFLWGEPIPYRTTLPGRSVTLRQFKDLLPPRRGSYRFYFKRSTDDRDCEGPAVYEVVKDDNAVLPTFDGKVVGKIERVDS